MTVPSFAYTTTTNCVRPKSWAENTQRLLLNKSDPQHEDYIRLYHYYVIGDMQDLEKLLDTPYQNEYYVTRNQIAALESEKVEDINDVLTAQELLVLPEEA